MRKNVRQALTALQKQQTEKDKLEPPHKKNVGQERKQSAKRKKPKRVKTGVRSQAQRNWLEANNPQALKQLEQEQQPSSVVLRVRSPRKPTPKTRKKVSPLNNLSRNRLSGKTNNPLM